jgi:hypothetical protein
MSRTPPSAIKPRHAATGRVSIGPVAFLESRTATPVLANATSTQELPDP